MMQAIREAKFSEFFLKENAQSRFVKCYRHLSRIQKELVDQFAIDFSFGLPLCGRNKIKFFQGGPYSNLYYYHIGFPTYNDPVCLDHTTPCLNFTARENGRTSAGVIYYFKENSAKIVILCFGEYHTPSEEINPILLRYLNDYSN